MVTHAALYSGAFRKSHESAESLRSGATVPRPTLALNGSLDMVVMLCACDLPPKGLWLAFESLLHDASRLGLPASTCESNPLHKMMHETRQSP